jgi:hypothetical protein
MTPEELATIEAHMAAEGAMDLDAAVATTAPDVSYEFPLQGKCFRGRDAARRFYGGGAELRFRRAAAEGRDDLPHAAIRARWTADDAMVVEAAGHPVMTSQGTVAVHPVAAVITASAAGVDVERIYVGDAMFELLTGHVADLLVDMDTP